MALYLVFTQNKLIKLTRLNIKWINNGITLYYKIMQYPLAFILIDQFLVVCIYQIVFLSVCTTSCSLLKINLNFDIIPMGFKTVFMPGWRNGRRYGLKIRCPCGREGSSPSFGTCITCSLYALSLFCF